MHCGMLPRPQRHLGDRECRDCAQGAAPGRQTAGGGRLQRETVGSGGRLEGRVHHCRTGDRGTCGYVGALNFATLIMVLGWGNVDHNLGGKGGEVPNGLHTGDGSPSLLECVRTGPQA